VLADEIGRGTATFDGLSIAWAVAEQRWPEGLRARAVFATHYHELNELEPSCSPNVANFQVIGEEPADRLVFLHQVRPGGQPQFMASKPPAWPGLPAPVVRRARQVLGRIRGQQPCGRGPAAERG